MATINPYLNYDGNCEEAFNFYKSVFGGEFAHMARFKEMPSENPIPDEFAEQIMHVALPISKETILMGSDTMPEFGPPCVQGTNFSISVNTDTEDEAKRIFASLSEGGAIHMPLEKTFWGALFGMFTDQFGINWMVNYDYGEMK
jgi:PhnB protein